MATVVAEDLGVILWVKDGPVRTGLSFKAHNIPYADIKNSLYTPSLDHLHSSPTSRQQPSRGDPSLSLRGFMEGGRLNLRT